MTTTSSPDPQQAKSITYEPAGPVVRAFMESPAFVRGIMGPIGSGKSTGAVIEILRRAAMQAPASDGIKYTRWAIIRNSYPELKSTTMKTWAQWCPLQYGKLNQDSPITHHVKTADLDMEILFLALDREDDVKKLLSLELTGAWVNEAREIPKSIIDALTGRVGRYPAKKDGGATWSGILMDTNPPDDQSWWFKADREETPEGWEFFQQPSGRSPEAENKKNLPDKYYERICAGKDPEWVKVYVDGEYGYVMEGKPVYPMFRDRIHVAEQPIEPIPGLPLLLGADFGLTPAGVIAQKLPDGRWLILDEFVADNCGVVRFSESLLKYVSITYPGFSVAKGWGDPAGEARAFSDERTAFEILREYTGWDWKPAPTNDIVPRLEVVIGTLNRLVDGNPGLLLSPTCKTLRKGFSGGYHYKPIRTGSGTQYHDTPAKNAYSHPHDALQALLLGAGEYSVVLNKKKRSTGQGTRLARGVDYNPLG
jgi:hypothetical protein